MPIQRDGQARGVDERQVRVARERLDPGQLARLQVPVEGHDVFETGEDAYTLPVRRDDHEFGAVEVGATGDRSEGQGPVAGSRVSRVTDCAM